MHTHAHSLPTPQRHIKRRMNWLHDPEFAALCLDSDEEEEEEDGFEEEEDGFEEGEDDGQQQRHRHLRPPSRQQQQQRRFAEEEGEYMAGGYPSTTSSSSFPAASPSPSEGPHPTTPLGDRTARYANHPGSGGSGNAAAAAKAAEQRRRGAAGSGGKPRGVGGENSVPPAVVGSGAGIAPPSEKGKKED